MNSMERKAMAQKIGQELAAELQADYAAGKFHQSEFKPEFDARLARRDDTDELQFLYFQLDCYAECLHELERIAQRGQAAQEAQARGYYVY